MKDRKDILADALAQLKGQHMPTKPPQEVVDRTIELLAEARAASDRRIPHAGSTGLGGTKGGTTVFLRLAGKLTAAAAVLLIAGYAVGRLSGPASVDMERLRSTLEPTLAASLEPALRGKLLDDMRHRYQLALANTYVQIKEELTQQYRQDLNRFAAQTLAASNATTNQLLAQLVEAIEAEQNKDLRRVARTLYELEQKRLADREALATNLAALAQQTETELERTRDDFVRLLVNYPPDQPNRQIRPTPDPNERS
jgi:hypothetical protein